MHFIPPGAFSPDMDTKMYSRSPQSVEFEAFWRSLRGERLIPDRGDFKPRNASRFLSNIVLLEAPGDGRDSLRIRVAGQVLQDDVPYRLAGTDVLDCFPEEYRRGAIETGRLMIRKPCGLWQITPVHSGGYPHALEVTAFPLSAVSDGVPLIIMHLLPLDAPLPMASAPHAAAVDTALEFRFLDVGTGEPQWPLAA